MASNRRSAAPAAAKRPRRPVDVEMAVLHKITRLIATLPAPTRLRVLGYVCARAESLPAPAEDKAAAVSAPLPPLLERMDAAAEA